MPTSILKLPSDLPPYAISVPGAAQGRHRSTGQSKTHWFSSAHTVSVPHIDRTLQLSYLPLLQPPIRERGDKGLEKRRCGGRMFGDEAWASGIGEFVGSVEFLGMGPTTSPRNLIQETAFSCSTSTKSRLLSPAGLHADSRSAFPSLVIMLLSTCHLRLTVSAGSSSRQTYTVYSPILLLMSRPCVPRWKDYHRAKPPSRQACVTMPDDVQHSSRHLSESPSH
eukprot:2278789-Rhodomonas_salina.1